MTPQGMTQQGMTPPDRGPLLSQPTFFVATMTAGALLLVAFLCLLLFQRIC